MASVPEVPGLQLATSQHEAVTMTWCVTCGVFIVGTAWSCPDCRQVYCTACSGHVSITSNHDVFAEAHGDLRIHQVAQSASSSEELALLLHQVPAQQREQCNVRGATVVHLAGWNGRLDVLEMLVHRFSMSVHACDASGATPMMYAAAAGQLAAVIWLRRQGASWLAGSRCRRTVLEYATRCGHAHLVEWLMRQYLPPSQQPQPLWQRITAPRRRPWPHWISETAPTFQVSPVHAAAKAGDVACVKALLPFMQADQVRSSADMDPGNLSSMGRPSVWTCAKASGSADLVSVIAKHFGFDLSEEVHLRITCSTPVPCALPPLFYQMQQLRSLRLPGLKLTSLSPAVGEMHALRVLDLRSNLLTSLPTSVGHLTALRTLLLHGTPLHMLPVRTLLISSYPFHTLGGVAGRAGAWYAGRPLHYGCLPIATLRELALAAVPSAQQLDLQAILPIDLVEDIERPLFKCDACLGPGISDPIRQIRAASGCELAAWQATSETSKVCVEVAQHPWCYRKHRVCLLCGLAACPAGVG